MKRIPYLSSPILHFSFFILHFSFFIFSATAYAQDTIPQTLSVNEEPVRMHSTLYGFGHSSVLDTYLSPFSYQGIEARIIRQTERPTRMLRGRISYQTMIDLAAQYTKNPAKNVKALSGGVRYSNAWLYNAAIPLHTTRHKLAWKAGLAASGYLGGVYNTRNGNNPAQAKADIMIDLTGQLHYSFRVRRKEWLVRYKLNIPFLGAAFSPQYGQSYYEIFGQGNYDHNVVFANFVNMPSMRHLLTIDIPIGHNRLRMGWAGEFMQAKFNGLKYHSYSNDFMIGFTKYFTRK